MKVKKALAKTNHKRPTKKQEVALSEATLAVVRPGRRGNVMAVLRWAARLAPWVVTLWLVAMTGWYCWTAVQALRHPPNDGDELKLASVWLAFVVTVVLSHLIFRRRIVTLIWSGVLVAVASLMIVLSGQLVAALITIWLVALAWTWGDWLLRRMGAKSSGVPLEWVCLSLSIGLALLSLVGLTLLLAHRMSPLWTWMVLLILTLIQWRSFLEWFKRLWHKARVWSVSREKDGLPEQGMLLVLLGFIGLFNLAWALAPEIMFDAIWYHLAVPKAYLAAQRLVNLTYGYNAHLVETIYTLALALHGQIVAKLLTLAMGVITTLGAYALGSKVFNRRVGLWAAALVYSTPLVSWLSVTTYVDLIVAMFLVATLLAFLQWRGTRQIIWLWATGFLAGAAAGAKLNALFGLPVIAIVLVWDLLRHRHLSGWSKVKGLAGCTLAASLVAVPYFLIVYIFTGNPFFPLLNGIFSRGSFRFVENLNSDASRFGLDYSLLGLLRLPFVLTFNTQRLGQNAASVGLCLVLLPLALTLFFLRRADVRLLLAVAAVYLGLLAYTFPLDRYYVPILPLVVVLAVAGAVHFSSVKWLQRVNLACLGLAIVTQAAVIPIQFWEIPERFPLKVAFGLETQEAFLSRAVIPYPAAHYLNKVIRRDQKVIGFDVEYVRFYLNAPLVSGSRLGGGKNNVPVAALAGDMVSNGYEYMMIDRQGPGRKSASPLLSPDFLDHFATIEFTANRVEVYHLAATPNASVCGENLLANPGFETLIAPGRPADWNIYGRLRAAANPAEAHTGSVSVQATEHTSLTKRLPVEPGQTYMLGHWSRADRPDQFGRLQINWVDARGKMVDASIDVVRAEAGWTWHQFYAMVPTGASVAEVYVSVHENREVWFDDYVFCKMQRPSQNSR